MRALVESARRKDSVLVAGLDPIPARLPPELRERLEIRAVREFCRSVLEAVEPYVAAVKLQLAYFERLGPEGMEVYRDLLRAAAALGLPTIADAKRGDIGPVAAAYAEAHLGVYGATCITVNPYMGTDAVLPFLDEARRRDAGGGVFVLVATSNPSAKEVQRATEPPLLEVAARLVSGLGRRDAGGYPDGYPDAGAVVGATRPEVGRRVRELLPESLFLAPGYGAQGGGIEEVTAMCGRDGGGVLVNSSRGLLYAYERTGADYREAAEEAARHVRDELRSAGLRV
ncbi:MAG: orotidine-5'-phosphate decarboxylase [Actinomycetota bacterium]